MLKYVKRTNLKVVKVEVTIIILKVKYYCQCVININKTKRAAY